MTAHRPQFGNDALTYIINDADDLSFDVGGIITDAVTGISYAVSKCGHIRIALGVPLCSCCDEPVEQCACLAPVIRLSETRVAA